MSDSLRREASPALTRRLAAVGLSLLATAALGVVEAYQAGLLRHVPEPGPRFLDADRVDAYHSLSTPDAALGMISYGVTLALVGAGDARRADEMPWLVIASAGKVLWDAASGAYLFAEQVTKHRRICGWCTVAAVASAVTVPVVLPEAAHAWRALRRR